MRAVLEGIDSNDGESDLTTLQNVFEGEGNKVVISTIPLLPDLNIEVKVERAQRIFFSSDPFFHKR